MNQTERVYKIDQLLNERTVITFKDLQDSLEISRATLKRDLAYLRDRLNAPIIFDRDAGGYRFDTQSKQVGGQYELPGLWFSAEEIHALLTMQHLLANLDTGGLIGPHIQPLMARLNALIGIAENPTEEVIKRIKIMTVGARQFHLDHFQQVGSALLRRKRLLIDYMARSTGETTRREVSPQRLIHYRDNWYLDAWCHLRDELRSFSVDAIQRVELLDAKARDMAEKTLDAVLGSGYGIFSGKDVQWATLRFTPKRAKWVAAEKWHPKQVGKLLEDGSYELKVPYSQEPELVMDILRYGADCEVVGPEELRNVVGRNLLEAVKRYGIHLSSLPTDILLAHVRRVNGQVVPHLLCHHLDEVSRLAAAFATEFDSGDWAKLAGLWHDLGKHRDGFQHYIRQCGDPEAHLENRVSGSEKTHSAAGALWAQQYLVEIDHRAGPLIAKVLSYLIAGHHAGLADWFGGLKERFGQSSTQQELADTLAACQRSDLLRPVMPLPSLSNVKAERPTDIPGRFALWVRMLFSCLVDADFLDTEAFMSPEKANARPGFMSLEEMELMLTAWMKKVATQVVAQGEATSTVNLKRSEVLCACLEKALQQPGVFTLTVPTGGGKTLSSLAFALRHAVHYKKRRVIYAIPYTSIIEQTADIFRRIFGDASIVEHHSNLEVDPGQETARSRLACENWDAPLIVTTNVQLLESLFASKTSRCRKLHNLVNSVVVLDEAQLLPVAYLQPVVDVLRLLVQDYGVTLVLCTATQPTLEARSSFDMARQLRGFAPSEVHEIVNDVPSLYKALDRVRVHVPADLRAPRAWEALAEEVAAHDAVLAIVNRRADARELHSHLKVLAPEGLWHLSGLMCAQHRSDTIAAIKNALIARQSALATGDNTAPIRVISTQLVEAGVDLDFPVVYRALAGLDSIAQAAGRCNREGRRSQGDVHVFVPPKPAPPGLLRQAEQTTRALWASMLPDAQPLAVERFSEYFRRFYGDANLDEKGIVNLLRFQGQAEINFRTAAEAFRLIDEQDAATVFVCYQRPGEESGIEILLNALRKNGPDRWLLRKLQRFGVSIYRYDLDRMLAAGDVAPIGGDCPGLYVQASDLLYHPVLGIMVDGAPGDPGRLVL